jgi:hypothetical protein
MKTKTEEQKQGEGPLSAPSCSAWQAEKIAHLREYLTASIETEWAHVRLAKKWDRMAYEAKGRAVAYRNCLEILDAITQKPNNQDHKQKCLDIPA